MSLPAIVPDDATVALEALVIGGDCSRLTSAQKIAYYQARCEAAGLDWRSQPLAYLRLSGKEVLYALKGATDQLSAVHGVRAEVISQTTEDGIRVVLVRASTRDGRQTDEIGCVPVDGLKGEALANALMKAMTKAKRRAVLAICGLGMLDETEVSSIPNASPVPLAVAPSTAQPPAPTRQSLPVHVIEHLDLEFPNPDTFSATATRPPAVVAPVDAGHPPRIDRASPPAIAPIVAETVGASDPITTAQRAMMFARARQSGLSDVETRRILKGQFGIDSTSQLGQHQFDDALEILGGLR